jgi:hypothetical protein
LREEQGRRGLREHREKKLEEERERRIEGDQEKRIEEGESREKRIEGGPTRRGLKKEDQTREKKPYQGKKVALVDFTVPTPHFN